MRTSLSLALAMAALAAASLAQNNSAVTKSADAARVFISDSQSWVGCRCERRIEGILWRLLVGRCSPPDG